MRTYYDLAERDTLSDRDNAIRVRLVIGLLDRELSQKLQLCSELTLNESISQARLYEQVKEQTRQQQQQQSVDFSQNRCNMKSNLILTNRRTKQADIVTLNNNFKTGTR